METLKVCKTNMKGEATIILSQELRQISLSAFQEESTERFVSLAEFVNMFVLMKIILPYQRVKRCSGDP